MRLSRKPCQEVAAPADVAADCAAIAERQRQLAITVAEWEARVRAAAKRGGPHELRRLAAVAVAAVGVRTYEVP